jgi:hypothetical protein
MEKKGIEALKKIMAEIDSDIELGIEIGKGGLNKDDIAHVPKLVERVKAIVALIPELKEAEAELKDLDLAEGVELAIQAVKEIQD